MRLGDFNDLAIAREVSIGFYLTSDDGDQWHLAANFS